MHILCCCLVAKSCPTLPSLSPGVCSNACLLSQWCHPTISSSVIPFSSSLQSFPASGFFQMNQLSVQFSHSVMSDSLWPHGLQHTRLPCPSPSPRACSNSWPSSQWCHPTISFSVIPFSSGFQSFSGSGSFPVSQFFTSGGQSIGASMSASVLPMNIQDWFPLGLIGFILIVQGTPKNLLQRYSSKASILQC